MATRPCLAAPLLLYASLASAREVGVAPATRKILPDAPVPAERVARLDAARNEWEAFQIVVRDAAGVPGLDASFEGLDGATETVRLYREHFVRIDNPSPFGVPLHERTAGAYPDPLVPLRDPYAPGRPVAAPFTLAAGEAGVLFVDVHVAESAARGTYRGRVRLSASDGWTDAVEVELRVRSCRIPRERTVGTAYGFGGGAVRDFHGGPAGEPRAGYDAIVDRYHLEMHEHRVDPQDANGPVEFRFDAEGRLLPVDWAAYDAAVAPWLTGSRFPDGVGMARFNVDRFRPGSGLGSLSEPQYKQAAAAFAAHLQEKGWWDRAYSYASDEPWLRPDSADAKYRQIATDIRRLLEASPAWRFKTLVTGPFDERVQDLVGIWCPVTPMYEGWWWFWDPKAGRSVYPARRALGEELWFYVCNANTPPYAGYDIDTRIGYEPRIAKWGAWYEGATGFLYWRMSFWPHDDPWNTTLDLEEFGRDYARNGDGFLFYPGDHDGLAGGKGSPADVRLDGPVPSYRLKQIRDGLEDWELFRLAESLGGGAWTRAQVGRAYVRFGDFWLVSCEDDKPATYCADDQPWTLDEAVLLDARRLVLDKLEHLVDPSLPDPEHPAAPPAGCGCGGAGGAALPGLALALASLRRAASRARRDGVRPPR